MLLDRSVVYVDTANRATFQLCRYLGEPKKWSFIFLRTSVCHGLKNAAQLKSPFIRLAGLCLTMEIAVLGNLCVLVSMRELVHFLYPLSYVPSMCCIQATQSQKSMVS